MEMKMITRPRMAKAVGGRQSPPRLLLSKLDTLIEIDLQQN